MSSASPVAPVCPACHGALRAGDESWKCLSCAKEFETVHGYPDLTLGERFDDEPSCDVCSNEARTGQFLAESYLLPLLARLFQARDAGTVRVLSVGCGVGSDVDALAARGFDAWGVDPGNRSAAWRLRRDPERYVLGNALHLPFPAQSFDMIILGCVIPHIGVIGDTYVTTPDYAAKRERAMQELGRVVRPGGYIMLSSPNRLCPLDLFHRNGLRSHRPRLHAPSESFLLSFGDYRRLLAKEAGCGSVKLLPVRNYWGFFSSSSYGLGRLVQIPVRLYFDLLSWRPIRWILASPFNPWLVVLAKK